MRACRATRSAQALERLPALLQEHKPALVLVSIGGNDLLRRLPEADTRANLQRICELAQAAGAQVLVLAVPRPSVAAAFIGSLSDHPMYAEVSAALKLPLHAQGWATVLADEVAALRCRSTPTRAVMRRWRAACTTPRWRTAWRSAR